MRKKVRIFAVFTDIILSLVCVAVIYYSVSLPDRYYVNKGEALTLPCNFEISGENNKNILFSSNSSDKNIKKNTTLKLFGLIPIKEVDIVEVDSPLLVPCGEPFGIKLLSDGVMVVGIGEVDGTDGRCSPAADAGICVGDIIVTFDGKEVSANSEIQEIISSCKGEGIPVTFTRGEKTISVVLTPEYSITGSCYQAGMWVRDSTAGIGTITFYDEKTHGFGGLGHPVCDVDTGDIIPLSSGEVCDVCINDVVRGSAGSPGELVGSFIPTTRKGELLSNTPSGLFGTLTSSPSSESAIPMALRQEVHKGGAYILSTVDGTSAEKYEIEIEKIVLRDDDEGKNMVIRITDEELLAKTGGIVQGMSGSPIIQDGKIVGAVTHVFVNDSAKGYAVFCETMYEELLEAVG